MGSKKFVVDKKNCKFYLFVNNSLVSETGYNIENPDKWFDFNYITLFNLKTFEKHQHKGYAKCLLKQIFKYVKNTFEVNTISILLEKDNYKAANLYFSLGFQVYMNYGDSFTLIKKL